MNPSFEAPALADGGFQAAVTGWTGALIGGPEEGVFNPTDTQIAGASGDAGTDSLPSPAFGHQVGFTGGSGDGALAQNVGTLAADTVYVLTVAVGARLDASFSSNAQLLLTTSVGSPPGTVLDSLNINADGTVPSPGEFVDNTLVVDSALHAAQVGLPLFIVLVDDDNAQSQVLWDNVRLEAIPEPAPLLLLGIGLTALLVRRARAGAG